MAESAAAAAASKASAAAEAAVAHAAVASGSVAGVPLFNGSLAPLFAVLGVALVAGVLCELTSFFLNQGSQHTELLDDIDRLTRKLDKLKEEQPKVARSRESIKAQEDTLKQKHADLGKARMKAQIASTVVYLAAFPVFNRLFGGQVVAKLPFQPMLFARSLAHRGLTGFAETDCSASWIFILAVSFVRANVSRLIARNPVKSVYGTAAEGGLSGAISQALEQQQAPPQQPKKLR